MRWLDSIPDSINMNLHKPWETLKEKGAWRAAVHWGHKESDKTRQLNSKELRDLCKLRTLWEGSRAWFLVLFCFLDSTYKQDLTVFVFLCLTYFIQHNALKVHHVVTNGKIACFFMAESYYIVYTHTYTCCCCC